MRRMVDIGHTAVWTGNEMIVWGGILYTNTSTSTGGRYCAPGPPAQLGNISTRAFVQTGDNVMIGGFIVQGTDQRESLFVRLALSSVHLPITFPMHWLIRHWNCTTLPEH